MKPQSYIPVVLILKERNKLMKSRNKHLMLASTFVGMICGLVLTHQQVYAAQTPPVSNQQSQITALAASENKAAAVNQEGYDGNFFNYDWAGETNSNSTVETKAVIRTINVHNPDGTMQTEKQIATLTREIKNNADGTQTLGPWSTAQWAAYSVPEITGYTANIPQVEAQTVTDSTVNQTIDVYYEPVIQQITVHYLDNGKIVGTQIFTGYAGETIIPQYRAPKGYKIIDQPKGNLTFTTNKQQIVQIPVQAQIIPTSESKVLIRTVNIHLPSGNMKTYRQVAFLTRNVYLNAVSGTKTYDDWKTGQWGALAVPVLAGYTASQAQVAAQTVTYQDHDQLVDIYYIKD